MELLQGPVLLDALLAMGKYTESDTKLIMERLLDAVAYMHLMGVVHRDIKLENLVLKQAGVLESVTVVDFGFAKVCARGGPAQRSAGQCVRMCMCVCVAVGLWL